MKAKLQKIDCSCFYTEGHFGSKAGAEREKESNDYSWGDWKRETWHRETIKIVGTDIARLGNAAPCYKGLQFYFFLFY